METKVAWSARLLRIVCAVTLALMLIPVNAFQAMAEGTAEPTDSTQATDQVATSDSSEGGATLETSSDSSLESIEAVSTTEEASSTEAVSSQPADNPSSVEAVSSQPADNPSSASEMPAVPLEAGAAIVPMAGDNGLTVKWIITDKWKGTGDASDYTMTPTGGALGIQATVGINSSVAYPKGKASFTIPKSLLTYRDGTTCDIVSMGVQPKNADPDFDYGSASYWYYEDDGNGNYVFTNCQEIPSNDAKAFSITYNIDTNKVKGGTVASITPTDVTQGIASTGCKITFDSKVELSTFVKNVIHDGQGERSVPASSIANNYWFGRTPDQFNFSDNMYMKYRLDAGTVGNEPHTISWTDTLSAADIAKGAKIVGMSIYEDGLHYTKSIEGTTGTYLLGERAYDNTTPATIEPSVGGSGMQQCYVLVEYPRNSYPALQPGDSVTFSNTGSATIEGIDTHQPSTLDDTKEAKWTKSSTGAGGGAGSDKGASAHDMAGAAAMLANNKDIDTPVFTVLHNSWDTKGGKDGIPVTQDVRDCYIIDDTLTAQTSTGYQVLNENDYYLKSLVFNKGVTDATWSEEADAYVSKGANHGSFEVYAATSTTGAYTKIADRTFDQVNGGTETDLTIDLGANKYVKWYVVYKGDQSAPAGQENAYVSFSCNAQYTFVGTSPAWDTLVPNDITGFAFSNSAATPATVAATGKLVSRDADKDYTANYQGNWSPDYSAAVPGSPNAERDALLAADQAAWGSMYSADRKGAGLPRLWGGAVVTVSPVEGLSSTGKFQTSATENDKPNARAITNFQQWGREYYTITGETLDVNLDELNLSLSRDSAVFYDLLPAGMKYFEDENHPTKAQGTTNEITAKVDTTVVTNYKGTGRDLVIFNVKEPVNTTNPAAGNTYVPASVDNGVTRPASGGAGDNLAGTDHLQTGFRVWYSTYTPYDSMSDVSVIQSLTSYQVPDQTMLGTAFADQVDMASNNLPSPDKKRSDVWPHYTVKDADGNPVMNNLRGREDFDPTTMGNRLMDAVYASLTTPVVVDFQASSGLNKKVAPAEGDGAGVYVDETTVEVGKDYTYRMQYTNSDYIQVQDLVVYDNLETANAAKTHWQGTLKRIDTSIAEARGIKPLIYVSTEPTTSLSLYDKSADANDFTKWTVNDPWELYVPTAVEGEQGYFDLSTVKAVAIDLGWTNDTQTARFTLPQLSSLSAMLTFTAPDSIELPDDVNTTAAQKKDGKAYNYAGVSMVYKITTGGEGTATTVSDPNKFTSVSLIDYRISAPLTKVDDQATPAAVPGAQFKLDQEAAGGRVTVSEDVWSASAADTTMDPEIAIGDLVYNNSVTDDTVDPPVTTTTPTPLKLLPGTYYLTETTAPDGFILDETEYKIVVTAADDKTMPATPAKVEVFKGTETTPMAANDDGKIEIVNPKIDVSVNKVLTSTAVAEDGTVEYKISLKNNGNTDLTDYTVTDTMTGVEYVSSTPTEGITYNAATDNAPASFKIDKLEAGKEVVITVKAKVTEDQWKNQINPTIPGEPNTDKVRVTDANGTTEATDTPAVGDTVYYKVTLTNTGKGTLSAGYETTDTFTGLRYVGTDTAVVDNGDGTLTWTTAADVAVDGEASIVLPFIVQPTITGEGDDVTVTLISNSANGVAVSEKVANVTQTKELTDVAEDGQMTYTITLKNDGGIDATDFKVKDVMDNLTYVSHTPAAPDVVWDGTDTFTVATVPAGGQVVITVVCEPAGDGQMVNTLVNPDPSDPSLSKVRITSETDTTPATDVPVAGQVIYYQLKVDNSMADARAWAEGEYVISDKFKGMSYIGDDEAITVEADGVLTWEVPAMAAGDVKTIIIPMMVEPLTLKDGEIASTTFINNAANNTIVTENIANVSYNKELKSADLDANTATYTITLSNSGNTAAKNYELTDTMEGLTYVSSTVEGATSAPYANGKFMIDTVPVGEDTVTITVVCTINSDSFSNKLKTLGGQPEVDKVRVNEDGTLATDVPTAGQTIYYMLTADNSIDHAVDFAEGEFIVEDTFEGMKYIGTDPAIKDNGDGTLTWTVPATKAGDKTTIIVPMKIDSTGENGESTTLISNKAANTVVTEKIANVSVVKDLVTPAKAVGETATYTLTLSNSGSVAATDFKLVDEMKNITYASSSVTKGNATATWDGSGFMVSDVPVGEDTVVITVECTTTAASYANHASVVTGDDDPVLSKVRVNKNGEEATETPVVGDTVYYKITLDNTKSESDVEAGEVFDDTYTGLTYVSAEGEGTVSSDGKQWTAPAVPAGESVSTIMSFTVDATTSNFISNKISSKDGAKTTVTGDTVTQKPTPVKTAATSAKTGDNTMVFGGAALVVLMLMAGGALYARRRSQKD